MHLVLLLLTTASADPAPTSIDAAKPLGDRWFVVLSSKTELGHVPPGLATLAAQPALAGHPQRLLSTWFKNLMPCYEIVVADTFPATRQGRSQALAYSAKLTAAGVDNYVKAAGPWVGDRPEVEGYCASLRAPPRAPEGFWFVDDVGVPLELGPGVDEALPRPTLRAEGSSYDVWRADLAVQTVGSWHVDLAVTGVTARGVQSCRVTGFARGVVGTPHFGMLQGEQPPESPACGAEEVYATLDCAALLVLPAEAAVTAFEGAQEAPPWLPVFQEGVREPLDVDRAAAKAQAEQDGTKVSETWTTTRFRGGAAEAWLVEVRIESGEGAWSCGREDHATRLAWWVSPAGELWSGPEDVRGEHPLTAADLDGDGRPELILVDELTGGQRVWSGTVGAARERSYCDCPC